MVDESDIPLAHTLRNQARALYQKALAFYHSGNIKAADNTWNQATDTMFKAVRVAGRRQIMAGEQNQEYEQRLASVKALLDAHARISKQKKVQGQHVRLQQAVQVQLTKADSLRQQGHLNKARHVLDEAYVAVKTAVKGLRNGDTLVRSLHFANKQEEYRYELDRNDTHRMLIKVLLSGHANISSMQGRAGEFMLNANKLRKQAEQQAAQGDYASAVQSLEASTRELVKVIRNSGLYIPG